MAKALQKALGIHQAIDARSAFNDLVEARLRDELAKLGASVLGIGIACLHRVRLSVSEDLF